jgi:hypothetical protein
MPKPPRELRAPFAHLLIALLATAPLAAQDIEQRRVGDIPGLRIVASFDGLGHGFVGPQGSSTQRNPSDNSLAVGPDHIVQTINTRVAIFTKQGKRFNETGRALYGPVPSNNVFRGFGGACEQINNGDVVVRYDQLAERWLFVMPIFRRVRPRTTPPGPREAVLYQPTLADSVNTPRAGASPLPPPPSADSGAFAMCYAVSKTRDPMGAWYRYEFTRPLFPDYPRPAVWPDGWYTPTSTGDEVIEKHVCVADRTRMLRGQDATEQCVIVKDVNFLNTSDLDGTRTPPRGAPNIVVAAGGTQLKGVLRSDELQVWRMHVDWRDPSRTRLVGPERIAVAPYEYLCGGQLTECVPQPGVTRRLDSQGDKIMARLVYRRFKSHEALVAVHSVATTQGGGGVRWYELRVAGDRGVSLYQQGTYAPDARFRWMASPAIDRFGNIGMGYSFGGPADFPGQRFAGRTPGAPLGLLDLLEVELVAGQASQTSTLRWEDYTQTAVDPSDDCTVWYVGDYLKAGAVNYSTRIGGVRMPGCR